MKLPTTVALGSATPVLRPEQRRRPAVSAASAMTAERGAVDGDRSRAAAVGDRDDDLVGALFRQCEGRGVDGELGRVGILSDAGRRD